MTSARSMQINLDATPYYHCMTRCARRGYLCGVDKYDNRDYSHRKSILLSRLKTLASVFAIKVCAYAIMSNHYHLVLFVDEKAPDSWDDEEVINRWGILYPKDARENKHKFNKIIDWRNRLKDISWFMRNINEYMAKLSNKEDGCSGKFWENRFKSQALLDPGALLSAMVYVDLNPIRAGSVQTPEESEFTSIYDRIQSIQKNNKIDKKPIKGKATPNNINDLPQPWHLMPIATVNSSSDDDAIDFKLSDYINLVDYTGRIIREDKRGAIPSHLAPIFKRLNLDTSGWLSHIRNFFGNFYHAIGHEFYIKNFSKKRKRTAKGINTAKAVYLPA